MKLYSIYDKKALCYNTPFSQVNDAVAIRTFNALCSDPESHISKYPEDFQLIYLGEFDHTTGQFDIDTSLKPIAYGNVIVLN